MDLAAERIYPTSLSNSTLLPLVLLSLASQRHSPCGGTKIRNEYDYVIVGGGAAGSVIANRLTELPCVNVLLLEAGSKPPLVTEVPAFSLAFWNSNLDWRFRMDLAAERIYPTSLSNSTLLPLVLLSLASQRHSPCGGTKIRNEYDYVIVGGGAAGSVIANRLTELPCVNVLLLEAGSKPPLVTEVPAFSLAFWNSNLDWRFRSVPQKYTGRGLVNRQVRLSAGKTLGGSTTIGDMLYVRGNRKNYDIWEAMGAEGWSYKDVFPYFLKLEDNRDSVYLKNGYHRIGGPQTVHMPWYRSILKPFIKEAVTEIGYEILDSNGPRQTGIYDFQGFLRDGQRCGAAKAYLVPAENRTNLDIVTNAMVKKVIIEHGRAIGVEFDYDGRSFQVAAKREVILTAGTYKTPQLLMLSGIGPKEVLEAHKIPVKMDLPVGKGLQDHAAVVVLFELSSEVPSITEMLADPENIAEFIKHRTGPYGANVFFSYLAFLRDNKIKPHIDFPNYELMLGEWSAGNIIGLRPEFYEAMWAPYENKPIFICLVQQLQPRSRGIVTLQSNSIYDPPLIDPRYLADPRDVDDMVKGMKTCQRIGTSKAMQKIGSRPIRTVVPGCEKEVADLDRYFRCMLRSVLFTIHHPVGTVRMGNPKDPKTVLDSELRVINIDGLRVCDASVMPKITSGNLESHVLMIAEKASDMIKKTIECGHSDYHFNKNSHNPVDSYWRPKVTDWKSELPTEWKFSEEPKINWNPPEDILAE